MLGDPDASDQERCVVPRHRLFHRLELPPSTPELPHTAFLAAQGDLFVFSILAARLCRYKGSSIASVLSRHKLQPRPMRSICVLEVFLAPLLQLSMSKGQMDGRSTCDVKP